MTLEPQQHPSIWTPPILWTTLGGVALIFLAAFESLAVTTVMPVVSEDLDGASLYAVAFAGTMAASIIGMIVVGIWCDRAAPLGPVTVSVLVFIAGLLIAGVATTMPTLVIGRLVQGLGAGGETVALYVVVARAYPSAVHGRVFAAFSAAWVVPSLIGPFIAGVVTDRFHWRWVFLGVAALTVVAFLLVVGRLRTIGGPSTPAAGDRVAVRVISAVVVALGATALSLLSDLALPLWGVILAAAALLALIAVAVRPLLPSGTLRLRAGLPSVVATRGLIAGAMLGAEVYVPYLLRADYHFSPTLAGLGLTGGAIAWSVASEVQGRIGDRIGNRRSALIGIAGLFVSITTVGIVAFTHASPVVIVVAWTLAGAGMGFLYPRLSVVGLAYSTPQTQGATSSALTIADSLGTAAAISIFGIATGLGAGFAVVFALAALLALFALVPGTRLGRAHEAIPG